MPLCDVADGTENRERAGREGIDAADKVIEFLVGHFRLIAGLKHKIGENIRGGS